MTAVTSSVRRRRVVTAPERQALLHTDSATGRMTAHASVRSELCRKGLACWDDSNLLITDFGRAVRRELLEQVQEFQVSNVPWSKVEEITDLFLGGLSIGQISRRMRVPGDDVEAVLAFRKVLPVS